VAALNGVDISHLRARQLTAQDFHRFHDIVALDRQNLAALRRMQPPESRAKLSLLLDFVEGRAGEAVADPYYGRSEHFDVTWRDVRDGAARLAAALAAEQ
jgi:protein-tyrosine phosphatase